MAFIPLTEDQWVSCQILYKKRCQNFLTAIEHLNNNLNGVAVFFVDVLVKRVDVDDSG